MTLGITILLLCTAAVAFSAWRIRRLRRELKRRGEETIKTLTDRFEREMEETLGRWEKR